MRNRKPKPPPSDEATRTRFEAAGYWCAAHGSHMQPEFDGPCVWRARYTA